MARKRGGRRRNRNRTPRVAVEKQDSTYTFDGHLPNILDFTDQAQWIANGQKQYAAFEESVWVYACIRALAQAAAMVKLRLFQVTPSTDPDPEIPSHEVLDLLKNPNPHQTEFEFREDMFWQLMLSGEQYTEKVPIRQADRNRGKFYKAKQLYALKSKHMRPQPDPRERVRGYVYGPRNEEIHFKPAEIMQLRLYNPNDDSHGFSPFGPALRSIDTDKESQEFTRRFFRDGALPGSVLETERMLPPRLVDRIRTRFEEQFKGAKRSHGVAVLEGGLKLNTVGLSFRDLAYPELREQIRTEILAAADVPPLIVGQMDGASWSNAHQQRDSFLTDSVGPLVWRLVFKLNQEIVAPYGEDLELRPDFEANQKSAAQKEAVERRARALWNDQLVTRNEARRMVGLSPVDDGGDDYKEVGMRGGSSLNRPAGGMRTTSEVGQGEVALDPERAPASEDRPRVAASVKALFSESAAQIRDIRGSQVAAIMNSLFRAQVKSLETEKQAGDGRVSPAIRASARFVEPLTAVLHAASVEAATFAVSVMGAVDAPPDAELREESSQCARKLVTWLAKSTEGGAGDTLARVELATRGELTAAINRGVMAALEANDWPTKTWVCSPGVTRPNHALLDGVTIKRDERFDIGESQVLAPGDSEADVADRAGCGCLIVPGPAAVPESANGNGRELAGAAT
jgi:HK97 family phage portal protein